jgi:hypothetical protein
MLIEVSGKDKPSFLELKSPNGFQLKLGPSFERMVLGVVTLLFAELNSARVGRLIYALGTILRIGRHLLP